MRTIVLPVAVAVGLAAASLGIAGRAEACSIRGNYCGYPSWAANTFEGRFGYKGDPRLLTDYYPSFGHRKPVRSEPGPRKHRR